MATKKYFDSLKQAKEVKEKRSELTGFDLSIFRIKHGRNKGKFFVGTYFEWINL